MTPNTTPNPFAQRNRERKAARMVAALDALIWILPSVDDHVHARQISTVLAEWPQGLRDKLAQIVSGKPDDTTSEDTWKLIVDAYYARGAGRAQHEWPDMAERIARVFDPPPVLKACGCGKAFTQKQWRELERLGRMEGEGGMDLELRNCPCGSTLSVDVPRVTVCSICGGGNCNNVNCAEEAGIKGLPREVRAA